MTLRQDLIQRFREGRICLLHDNLINNAENLNKILEAAFEGSGRKAGIASGGGRHYYMRNDSWCCNTFYNKDIEMVPEDSFFIKENQTSLLLF